MVEAQVGEARWLLSLLVERVVGLLFAPDEARVGLTDVGNMPHVVRRKRPSPHRRSACMLLIEAGNAASGYLLPPSDEL